jgi:hypothetical protein
MSDTSPSQPVTSEAHTTRANAQCQMRSGQSHTVVITLGVTVVWGGGRSDMVEVQFGR